MEEQVQSKKHIYTKKDIIFLYSFCFVWSTIITTGISDLLEILPDHYIIYFLLQSGVYFMLHKLCQYLIVNNIEIKYSGHESSICDMESSTSACRDSNYGIGGAFSRHHNDYIKIE